MMGRTGFLATLLIILLAGCASLPSQTAGPPPSQEVATGQWYPRDGKGTLSPDARKALAAVQQRERGILRTYLVDYHYTVSPTAKGWEVVVLYVWKYIGGTPVWPPKNAYSKYAVNKSFEIISPGD